MAIKSIAVLIDGMNSARATIEYSINLTASHGAHLICMFEMPTTGMNGANGAFTVNPMPEGALVRRQKENLLIENCRYLVERIGSRRDLTFEFRAYQGGERQDKLFASRHADLVVMGVPRSSTERCCQVSTDPHLGGVPFLLVPDTWAPMGPPKNILVGWNGSPEARRAVGDALPLLAEAPSVTVLVSDSEQNNHDSSLGSDLGVLLIRHGVQLTVEQLQLDNQAVADAVLSYIAAHSHDLLVLGACGQSRTPLERLDDMTRSLITQSPVPLLISR